MAARRVRIDNGVVWDFVSAVRALVRGELADAHQFYEAMRAINKAIDPIKRCADELREGADNRAVLLALREVIQCGKDVLQHNWNRVRGTAMELPLRELYSHVNTALVRAGIIDCWESNWWY